MEDCIFCKIIGGEVPAEKIYEDAHTLAFLDRRPVNPGHTLVVPKVHSRNILDVGSEAFAFVMESVRKLSPFVKQAVGADGVTIHINNEPAGGQDVFHLHVHVIPHFQGDEHGHWHGKEYGEGEAAVVGDKIRAALA